MYKKLLFLLLLLFAAVNAQQINNPQQTLNQTNKSFFIQNKGQWDPEVKYLARVGGMNAWITSTGVVYDYYRIKKNFDETKTSKMNPREKQDYENKNITIQGHVVKMQLVNSEMGTIQVGNNQREGYYNYFMSNDKTKWASFVPLFDNVEIQGVYKNINVKYYYDNGMLRYDYRAKPGADISQIKFKFDGQKGLSINSKGDLILKTSIGDVTNGKLYAFQMEGETKIEVPCQFEQMEDGTIGLKAADFDAHKELIIDPLVYSTFIGGNVGNSGSQGNSIAIDASGNAYVTGWASSSNYPTTPGAYNNTINSGIFITKLNSNGSGLIYSTFIGGGSVNSIAVDTGGNAYITGSTNVPDFPSTPGAFQTTYSGDGNQAPGWGDAFITKLNPTGSGLIYSTFIGGNGSEEGNSIKVDGSGNAFITGCTSSINFPVTTGAYQTIYGGSNVNTSYNGSCGDAFITELNSTGSRLVYSTYIGGIDNDIANSLAIDKMGNVYITGESSSQNFPTTLGAYQTVYGGGGDYCGDVFILKLNPAGTGLLYSTYIGGNGFEDSKSIAIDDSGNAYITGWTNDQNYPFTPGAYQITPITSSGLIDNEVFVTKLNPTGSGLAYSTLIGGGGLGDVGYSIAVDKNGNAYITGFTSSQIFPTTPGAFQTSPGGLDESYYHDAFITELNALGSKLKYSTFMGGNLNDVGTSIAIDNNGNSYITGFTNSSNFPTTPGALQSSYVDYNFDDIFVAKLCIPQVPLAKDVGIIQINGTNQTKGGTLYTPSVQIQNYGAGTESFGILCKIYDYKGNFLTQNTQNVSYLAPDSVQTIIFIPYNFIDNYLYKVEFITQLIGDLNTDNNTLSKYVNTYSTSKKDVLVEVMTETGCQFAPGAQIGCNDLINNDKNATVVEYHGGDTFDNGSGLRFLYYGWGGFPTTFFDGTSKYSGGSNSNSMFENYLPLCDSMYSIKTPLDIGISGNVTTTNNYSLNINIKKLAPFINQNTKLFVALTENKIPYSWMGQTEVDYCERLIFPDVDKGFSVDLVTHDSVSVPLNITTQPSWITANLELSAWVQDIYTREIFNTTKIKLSDLSKWQSNITVKDNGNVSQSLTFGQSLIASDRIDTALGEAALPPTAFGFDARFHLPTNDDSWKDYRLAGKDSLAWLIKFQPGTGGYPITFTWDSTSLPKGSFILKDIITGSIVNINMKSSSSYKLTNTGINELEIEYNGTTLPDSVRRLYPLNASLGITQPLQLKWATSAGANSYRLQVSPDSTFSTTFIDTLGLMDTTFKISGLNNLTTYYWRVNAMNSGGTGPWGQVWNFKTLGNPTQAVIIYPAANNVNIPLSVTFKWDKSQDQLTKEMKIAAQIKAQGKNKTLSLSGIKKIANVSRYWFELMKDTSGTGYTEKDTALADTIKRVSGLQNLTSYWWRVRAMNEVGWGDFTNWSKFTTIIDTPGVASLISPNSSSNISDTASSIMFKWRYASFASAYELQVSSNKIFSPVITDSTGITDTVFTYYPKNLSSTFYWRVRSSNIAGTGSWSTAMTVSLITGINKMKGIPVAYELSQNYPNPFNPSTVIRYGLPKVSNVKIKIYNLLGQVVTSLANGTQDAGYHEVTWNASNKASGIYLYTIEAVSADGKGNFRSAKKLILLK